MKIAILSFYSGIHERGVERWTFELAKRLSKKHKVTVFQNGPNKGQVKYEVYFANISYDDSKQELIFPMQKRAFLDYKSRKIGLFTLSLLPKLWKMDYDVVIPTDGGWEPAFIRILTWFRRKKMVIVGHAGIGWDDRNNLWTFPDCFIALSSYTERWAKKVNPFVRVEYIPNGVDTRKFKPGKTTFKSGLKKPIILCVGALTPTKRIDLAIKAVARIKDVSLLIVGDGDLREKVRKLGKNLLGERFRLTKTKFEKMPNIYRTASLFTIPSESFYSFEIVLVEAMATNLPVVANYDPIRREIVGPGGVLVDPEDIRKYAKYLEKALKVDWGEKPRKQAEKFSWDKIVVEYEELFETLDK